MNDPCAETAGDSSSLSSLSVSPPRRFLRCDIIFIAILFLAAFFIVIGTGRGRYGLSWDEAYYYGPSREAARWLGRALFSGDRPLSGADIDAAWSEIRELPSVVKICLGTSSLIFAGITDRLTAFRLPSAAAYGLTLILLYLLMFRPFGRAAALTATFSYALMPRVFGHAHIGAAESILSLMTLLTVFCFIKGLEKPRWSVLLGIVFGLALNTKINAVFLPAILLPWAHIYHRKKYANNFFAMVFLSPVAMIATWPWLWPDAAPRFLEYVYFFARHQFTAVWYFGAKYNYGSTLAPWHYPFAMTFYTVPPLILFFALVGMAAALRDIRKKPLPMLFLWGAVLTLVISALPGSPKYDGVRLFLPAFLFLAALAGCGSAAICERIEERTPLRGKFQRWDVAAAATFVLIFLTGIYAVAKNYPCDLSYFNVFAGGLRGAWKKGMETTYWGEAVNDDVINALNELPKGASVRTLALHGKVFDYLQEWGALRADLKIDKGEPPYDYHLLLVRKGFFARPEWCLFLEWPKYRVFECGGVPLVILFRTGPEFEKAWPKFNTDPRGR